MRRLFIAVVLVAACGSAQVRAQNQVVVEGEEAIAGEVVDLAMNQSVVVKTQLSSAVDRELEILQEFVKLDEQTLAGLKIGIRPALDKAARDSEKNGRGVQGPFGLALTPALRQAIDGAVGLLVKDKESLQAYRTDAALRRKFDRDAAILGLVCAVDQSVQLSTAQVAKVQDVAGALFDKGQLAPTSVMIMLPGQAKPGEQELKQVLTAEQFAYWQKVGGGVARMAFPGSDSEPTREKRKEALSKQLNAAAAIRTAFLKQECKLSEKQIKQLQLAAKGAVSGVVDLRLDAEDSFRGGLQGGNPDRAVMQLAMMEPGALLDSKSRWNNFVGRVLNDEQEKAYAAVREARGRRVSRFMATYLIVAMSARELPGGSVNLTGEQQRASYKLFSSVIKSTGSLDFGSPDPFRGLLEIPEEKYVAAMGPENWKAFQPLLTELKSQIPAEEADGDADK